MYCNSSGYAILAQLVEQLIRNEQVVGSNPMDGSQAPQQRRFLHAAPSVPLAGWNALGNEVYYYNYVFRRNFVSHVVRLRDA